MAETREITGSIDLWGGGKRIPLHCRIVENHSKKGEGVLKKKNFGREITGRRQKGESHGVKVKWPSPRGEKPPSGWGKGGREP